MPRKRRYRKRRRRRNNRRNYPRQQVEKQITVNPSSKTTVVHHGLGMPNAFITKLRYSETKLMSTFPYQEQIYRANSLFDPDQSGSGSQPLYRDELSAIYESYVVYASNIDVQFLQTTNTGGNAFIKAGVYPLPFDSGTAVGLQAGTERDGCVFGLLGPNSGGDGILNLSNYIYITQNHGLKKSESEDTQFLSASGGNPPSESFWHIFAGSLDGGSVVNIFSVVNITYYVKFFNKKAVARS